jgi:hypothetical protein
MNWPQKQTEDDKNRAWLGWPVGGGTANSR